MADHRSEIDLPDSLYGMDDLALDMRLMSSHRADRVWHRVNPELWVASRNPWAVLKSIGQLELEELGNDDTFSAAVRALIDDRTRRKQRSVLVSSVTGGENPESDGVFQHGVRSFRSVADLRGRARRPRGRSHEVID